MPEVLSESTWTAYTKKAKLSLDDGPLLKALAKFDKTTEAKPEPRLEALRSVADEIRKQVTALSKRKKELGDKPFNEAKDKLGGLLAAAEALQKDTEKAAEKAAEAAAAKDSGDGDDEDSPALLTTKLIPLLREVRKGELTLQALIATAGKETVVLLQRKPISPARGKLLKEQMTNPAGLKFIRGEATFENNALTFIVQAAAGGLAKKIKEALLKQTDLRLKVRVRGEDPNDVDDDGDPLEAVAATAPGAEAAAAPAAPRQDDGERARYEARAEELTPKILAALQAQPPEASKIRVLSEFAREKAEGGQYKAAVAALDQVAKLLPAEGAAAATGDAKGTAEDAKGKGEDAKGSAPEPGPAFNARLAALLPHVKTALAAGGDTANAIRQGVADAGDLARKKDYEAAQAKLDQVEQLLGDVRAPAGTAKRAPSLVALQKARLTWDGLRNSVQNQFSSIERAALEAVRAHNADPEAEDRFDEAALAAKLKELFAKLDSMDQGLIDKLDEALNAEGPQRDARYLEASELVRKFRAFAASDPLLAFIDDNGFASTDIRARVDRALAELGEQF